MVHFIGLDTHLSLNSLKTDIQGKEDQEYYWNLNQPHQNNFWLVKESFYPKIKEPGAQF